MRSVREGESHSILIGCGYPSALIRPFAVAMMPDGGSNSLGISSYGMKPLHSYASVSPGTGTEPSPDDLIGTNPVAWYPMWPSTSAYTTFCPGAPNFEKAARNSSQFFALSTWKKGIPGVSSL